MPLNQYSFTKILMGMPITVKVVSDTKVPRRDFDMVFDWFAEVDAQFSTFKPHSEVSRINNGLPELHWSSRMKKILALSEETKQQTNGYFDVYRNGKLDPSGIVKGWAIHEAANKLLARGYNNFSIDAGGDIQVYGTNVKGESWQIGIRSPFRENEIIKVLRIGSNEGVATSGAYIRGQHIYNPLEPNAQPTEFASVTIIGPDIYEADRFATAIYAMGESGAAFAERRPNLAAYCVRPDGTAVMTSGFGRYVVSRPAADAMQES